MVRAESGKKGVIDETRKLGKGDYIGPEMSWLGVWTLCHKAEGVMEGFHLDT